MHKLLAGLAFAAFLPSRALAIVAPADTVPPAVSISAPASGSTLQANANETLLFSATDNVGLASFNVFFSADGVNFTTTLAVGLSGTSTSFPFRVPAVATTRAALRVDAYDAAGNRGSASIVNLTIQNDSIAPTVTVTSPQAKDKFRGGEPIPVSFASSDDTAVVSHEIQLSLDGGGSFSTLAVGLPGSAQSYSVTAPDAKEKDAVIRVIARDAAGNAGQGSSAPFKLKADNKD